MLTTKKIMLSPVLFRNETIFERPAETDRKAERADSLNKATVSVGGNAFDADEESMDRMARIVSYANFLFNQAIGAGTTQADAYAAVYLGNTLDWVLADNTEITVTVEDLANVLGACNYNMGSIWSQFRS